MHALAAAAAAVATVAIAAPPKPGSTPSPAKIKRDVAAATSSKTLWSTVNVCNTKDHPDEIGIRGQMPALGFATQLSMTVRLKYYDFAKHRFEPIPHVSKSLSLGTVTNGTVQDGALFRFNPPVILSGTVTFDWLLDGKVIGSATRSTSHGDKGVDDSDPENYSAATCRMDE
jgi:hypothetical protein